MSTDDPPPVDGDPFATRRGGPSRRQVPPPATMPVELDPGATRAPLAEERRETGAPARAGAGSSAGMELPRTEVSVPVYEPPRRRKGSHAVVGAALVVAAGAGFGVGYLVHGSAAAVRPGSAPTTTTPFFVTGVKVHVAKRVLSCPSAVARLSATVTLDHGGGTVRYDWDLLGSTVTSPQSVSVPTTDRSAVATLAYTLSGRGATRGQVRLHLLSPENVYSAPVTVRYSCSKG